MLHRLMEMIVPRSVAGCKPRRLERHLTRLGAARGIKTLQLVSLPRLMALWAWFLVISHLIPDPYPGSRHSPG